MSRGRNLYDILGVDSKADAESIKKSYRKKAQETHPDRVSGKEEEFHAISKAYMVLSNPAKRKQYDETGIGDDTMTDSHILSGAASRITALLDQIISKLGDKIIYVNVMAEIVSALQNQKQALKNDEAKLNKRIVLYQKVMKRVQNDGTRRIIENFLEEKIKGLQAAKLDSARLVRIMDEAISIMQCYDFDEAVQPRGTTTDGYSMTYKSFINVFTDHTY